MLLGQLQRRDFFFSEQRKLFRCGQQCELAQLAP
jgi:hypothetical protein